MPASNDNLSGTSTSNAIQKDNVGLSEYIQFYECERGRKSENAFFHYYYFKKPQDLLLTARVKRTDLIVPRVDTDIVKDVLFPKRNPNPR